MPSGGVDVTEQMEIVATRIEFIELLSESEPMQTRDVVDALQHSRSTVTRALRTLREAELIEKTEHGYTATLAGVMAAEQYRRYETASEAILSAKDLLQPIPTMQAPPVDLLVGADTIHAEAEIPVRPLEAISDRVRTADAVQMYLPTLLNTHLLRIWHRAVVGNAVESTAVFAPQLLTVLKGQYPQLLSEMASMDGFKAVATEGRPYGVVLTTAGDTTTVSVIVYENDTAVRGVITNDAQPAVDWARAELERLTNEGSEVTGDLAALSAAVGDGTAASLETSAQGPAPGRNRDGGVGDSGLPLALETEGFTRLSEAYFTTQNTAAPAVSWRTGFTLAEVRAGHAVDRVTDGRNLTDQLVATLRDGTPHVVLGPPGSGKSTICMSVACQWYEHGHGPVLYRERGAGDSFESVALLEAYLRQTDGHTLVVVEDAVREQARAIFDVMQALDNADRITFLLDARAQEWQDADEMYLDARHDAYRRSAVDQITVPTLNERECQRFVEHFSSLVGEDIDLTGTELFSLVTRGTAVTEDIEASAGDILIAQQYISRHHDPSTEHGRDAPTALDEAVRQTCRSLVSRESEMALRVAVLANVLNAAGVSIAQEYLYALATDGDYDELEQAVAHLRGLLLFESDGRRSMASPRYRTYHELWSLRFLYEYYTIESTSRARAVFGDVITALLGLADNLEQRQRIERHLDGRTPHLHRIEADATNWADELTERIFHIGVSASALAPLFGETADSAIHLPDACSPWLAMWQAYWRGRMNVIHGDLSRADREFRALRDRCGSVELPASKVPVPTVGRNLLGRDTHGRTASDGTATQRDYCEAIAGAELGEVARKRGDLATATEYLEQSLGRYRDIGDRYGEASVLKRLGNVAYKRGELDTAERHYEASIEIFRETNNEYGEGTIRHNLGLIAYDRGDLQTARDQFERSLDLYQELGDRYSEATALQNCGAVARDQGDIETAISYLERSLLRYREIGDRHGEADALRDLGVTAHRQGKLTVATERLERSLELFRDIGNSQDIAHTLEHLGAVARERGEYETAIEHLKESLAMCREIDDRHGEATTLLELGTIARERGELTRARDRFETAADICTAAAFEQAVTALAGVIEVCEQLGCDAAATEWRRRATEYADRHDRPEIKRELEARLGQLASDNG